VSLLLKLLFYPPLTEPQASIDATGSPLTDEALTAAKNADAVLLGAIGGPVRSTVSNLPQPPILIPSLYRNGAPAPSAPSRAS
jgi:hypothetical protein